MMMKNRLTLLLITSFFFCAPFDSFCQLPNFQKEEPKIFVNNRILAHVNGKPITTYDLVKKMDMTFYKNYPEYVSSNEARFQFYQEAWKYILDDLLNEELILADAKEHKIEVSSGDVRQEIEAEFGPNVIENLDKAGMSLEEATKSMQSELTIQKMIAIKANSKALRQVTPSVIRKMYQEYIQNPDNKNQTTWNYRVVTIKDRTPEKSEELATKAAQVLNEGISVDDLPEVLKTRKLHGRRAKVTISNEIKNNEKEVSSDYKKMLVNLDAGMYSHPFPYKSRAEKGTVYRIIYVKEKIPGGFPTYKEMEPKIKQQLLNQASEKETDMYISKLRQHYHLREEDIKTQLPEDYQPFILKRNNANL